MKTNTVIFAVGALIALSVGSAIMLTNHYQVSQPFTPTMFTRLDRWTGRVERCSSMYDEKTYCGSDLERRIKEAIDAEHAAEYQKFLSYGYTPKEIEGWPQNKLDGARNIVSNGGDNATLDTWIHEGR
jgi:hypothetical protein